MKAMNFSIKTSVARGVCVLRDIFDYMPEGLLGGLIAGAAVMSFIISIGLTAGPGASISSFIKNTGIVFLWDMVLFFMCSTIFIIILGIYFFIKRIVVWAEKIVRLEDQDER
jgi:hypothetical protein